MQKFQFRKCTHTSKCWLLILEYLLSENFMRLVGFPQNVPNMYKISTKIIPSTYFWYAEPVPVQGAYSFCIQRAYFCVQKYVLCKYSGMCLACLRLGHSCSQPLFLQHRPMRQTNFGYGEGIPFHSDLSALFAESRQLFQGNRNLGPRRLTFGNSWVSADLPFCCLLLE